MNAYPFEPTPATEIRTRIKTLKTLMSAQGPDALLITHKPDLFYFSGTAQDAYLYVDQKDDPVLFVRRYLPRALRESPLSRIEPIVSFKEVPGLAARYFRTGPRTCGLADDVVPVRDYRFYRQLFPNTRFVDGTPLIEACRRIKSPFEIGQMEKAAQVSGKTFDFMADIIRPGMTEMTLCGEVEAYSRTLGHSGKLLTRHYRLEGFPFHLMSGASGGLPGALDSPVCGTGTSIAYPYGAGPKPIMENEPILMDFGTLLDGYHIDESRMFVLGNMPEKADRASRSAIDILYAVQERMRPGVTAGELFEAAWEAARGTGLEEGFLGLPDLKSKFIGHGVGLELVEAPILAQGRPDVLEPGMVLAVEPKFIFRDAFAAGIESMILVTETGSRFLSQTENKIFYC